MAGICINSKSVIKKRDSVNDFKYPKLNKTPSNLTNKSIKRLKKVRSSPNRITNFVMKGNTIYPSPGRNSGIIKTAR